MFEHESKSRCLFDVLAVTVASIFAAGLAILPAGLIDPAVLVDGEQASRAANIVLISFNFVMFIVVGVVYLRLVGLGRDWIDLRWPDKTSIRWSVIGSGVILAVYVAFVAIVTVFNLEVAENSIVEIIDGDVLMVFALMVIVVTLNAPAEEFLYRNIIQKRLYDAFSVPSAIIITSVVFASIHIPTYVVAGTSMTGTATSIIFVFTASLVMGAVYFKSKNLIVPIAVHACLNLVVFGLYLVEFLQ